MEASHNLNDSKASSGGVTTGTCCREGEEERRGAATRDGGSIRSGSGMPSIPEQEQDQDHSVALTPLQVAKRELLREIEAHRGDLSILKQQQQQQQRQRQPQERSSRANSHDGRVTEPEEVKRRFRQELEQLQGRTPPSSTNRADAAADQAMSKSVLEREMQALAQMGMPMGTSTRTRTTTATTRPTTSRSAATSTSSAVLSGKEILELELQALEEARSRVRPRSTTPHQSSSSAISTSTLTGSSGTRSPRDYHYLHHHDSSTAASSSQPGAYASVRILHRHPRYGNNNTHHITTNNNPHHNDHEQPPPLPQPSQRSLVEANPVEEDDELTTNIVVLAQQIDHAHKFSRFEFVGASLICVALSLVIVIGSFCGSGYCQRHPITASPQEELLAWRETVVRPQIEAVLVQALENEQYFNETTIHDKFLFETRRQALDWIVLEDPLRLEASHDHLLQRFILVLLYFQTTTKENPWHNCNPLEKQEATSFVPRQPEWCYLPIFEGRHEIMGRRWLSNAHECDWAGVTCLEDDTNSIVQLKLASNELNGPIPWELAHLPHLQQLDLSDNLLTGSLEPLIHTQFGPRLQRLDVQQNYLTGTIPNEWLLNLDRLASISLSNNLFTGTLPAHGPRRASLEWWGSEDNILSGTIPEWIFDNHKLQTLLLSGNNGITGTLPTRIGNLQSLGWLRLHSTKISGSLPSEIGLLQNLLDLTLSYTAMNGSLPEELFTGCTALQVLDLNDCGFAGTISSSLGRLTHLGRLDIANNQFRGQLPRNLTALTSIYQVIVNGNDFTGSMPQTLCHNLIEYGWALDMKAQSDCFTDPTTGSTAILCDCCTTCCDPTTGICFLSDFGRVSSWERNNHHRGHL